ncbi:hypothetical protein Zmor_002246 [Zophobas morio]|uniref:Uncharacterized protein n=1 Tax=Zophobas morio TaxID=2755281 RepID=A0AA38MPW2_9CUCU|nr:hypothetical protein Zmor_002246 [Zophobas morio]
MTPNTLPEGEEVSWLFLFLEVRSVEFDPPTTVSTCLDHLPVGVTVFGIAAPERKTVSSSPVFFLSSASQVGTVVRFPLQGRHLQVQEEPVLKEVVAQEEGLCGSFNSIMFVNPFCIYLI